MPTQSPSRYFAFLIVLLPAAFIFTLLSFNQEAAASHHILYVNAAADPGGNGSSWEDAFTDLQDALADATIGDEIWVAAGLYKPTDAPTDREASFYLRQGVALYGGFTGTETARDQRDWETNLTVLSGDIDDNDLTDPAGVVTNTVNITGTNSYHVVGGNGLDETAVLDGFTITAGQADGLFPHGSGGGMLNDNSHPSLANVTFIGNVASFGGGMANVTGSSPTLTTVTFSGNGALQGGGMGNGDSNPGLTDVTFIGNDASFGGGMGNQNSNPSLTNVTFIGNSAEDSEEGRGGGMSNFESSPSLSNVTFSDNSADGFGGGMFGYASSPTLTDVIFNDNSTDGFGGGMFNEESSSPILNNVLFNGNSAAAGGGMANFVGSNSALTNVVFSDNSVDGLGGGMYNYYSQPTVTDGSFDGNTTDDDGAGGGMFNYVSHSTLTNVSFSDNSANHSGGGIGNYNSSPTLTNVSFDSNNAASGGGMSNLSYDENGVYSFPGRITNFIGSNPTLTNVTFTGNIADTGGGMANTASNPILTNVVFSTNIAIYGGGMANNSDYNNMGSNPTLTNVTFSGNIGSFGGGLYNENVSDPLIQNSIFWLNQDLSGLGTPAASIYNDSSTPTIRYSLVQGCNPHGEWVSQCGADSGSNLADVDPLFVENPGSAETPMTAGNLRLQPGSPAIDAGNNEYVAGVATDLDGNPRIVGTAVNLGPYEANAYLLTMGVVGDGNITADPLQSSYLYGEVVTVTAVPDSGWVFLTWSGDLSGSANPATIPMDANKTITATMEQEITGVAAVNSSPTTLGQTTFFTATVSGGTNIEHLWSFGDGPDSSGQHASHVYGAAGVYTATLTASNGAGSVQTTTSVIINNEAPIAHASPNQTTEVNQPVMLDGSGSFDPDGHEPLGYGWSQTGGPAVNLSDPTTAQPTFTTPSVGSVLTFTLVVSDSFGLAGDPDAVVVTVRQPAIAIGKTANPPSAGVGDTITYTYSLTNTGDVALSQINPVDDRLGPLFTAPISLTVGQMISQTLTYTVVEADLPGPLLNTVVVSGTSPLGTMVTDSDMAIVLLSSQPAIYILKEASVASAGINEVITYTYTVMNVGDVTLTGVTAVDDQLGPISLLTATLPSLASTSGVLTYTVGESDLPGPLTSTVTASGTPPVGSPVTATAALSLPLTSSPALEVALTAVPSLARLGDIITYSLSLTNSGDVTLHNLSSTVTVAGGFTLPDSLAPGIVLTVAYSYTVTTADLPGPLTNTVTITAVPTANDPMTVTTAVATRLEPHAIYLPLIINSVAASDTADSWSGHGGN